MKFDTGLDSARVALKLGLGGAAFLAGLDKYFNVLADWPTYVSPVATALLPLSPQTLMHLVGPIEMAVGILILSSLTRLGSYVAAAWLVLIAINLVTTGRFFDVAVRDIEMAIAAYALARLTEARFASVGVADAAESNRIGVAA